MSGPDDVVWYILRDGKRVGPLTAEEFTRFEETGRLLPTDQVWQTGMHAWTTYGDYDMRKAATRFASPSHSNSSPKTSSLHATANTLTEAVRGFSRRIAQMRSLRIRTRDENTTPELASEAKPGNPVRAFAEPLGPIVASRAEAREPSSQPRSKLVPGAPDHIPQLANQHRSLAVHADTIEHVASHRASPTSRVTSEAEVAGLQRLATRLAQPTAHDLPERNKQDRNRKVPGDPVDDSGSLNDEPLGVLLPVPRLASEERAAAHIGLDLTTFRRWVADGRLPGALPDCGKYDLKAIHLALDRMSNITSQPGAPIGVQH